MAIKFGGKVVRGAAAWRLAGHPLVGADQLFSFASLVLPGFYFSLCLIFLFVTIYYYYYLGLFRFIYYLGSLSKGIMA